MLNAACIGQAAAWEAVWSSMGRAEGFGGPPKGQVYVGRHCQLCMLLLFPCCARWALHARSPSGKTQLQPKQSTLCKRPSLLLERCVPARPSPAGASQINAWLGFST